MDATVAHALAAARLARRDNPQQAQAQVAAALIVSRALGTSPELCWSLYAQGQLLRDGHQPVDALAVYGEGVTVAQALHNPPLMAHGLRHLGDLYCELHDYALAETHLKEALNAYQKAPNPTPLDLANTHLALGTVYQLMGSPDNARHHLREAQHRYQALQLSAGVADCLQRLADLD
ncbi:MAG: tetratricopeptide repeat protein [Bacteroidia bacterium]|nr:tetratricopeptide repeat protein [Bacteroidia bacterium]